jgi:hypothetical protein
LAIVDGALEIDFAAFFEEVGRYFGEIWIKDLNPVPGCLAFAFVGCLVGLVDGCGD